MNGDSIVGLASVILVFAIPLVAILSKHQRSMAELMRQQMPGHNQNNDALQQEIRMLRAETQDLKDLVRQQMIMMDSQTAAAKNDTLTQGTNELQEIAQSKASEAL
ncbi:MAG: hypothetical protein JNM85_09580 [Chthonomonas sp.]|nr:hypothetical protein [Chthonomonas sp.]